MRAEIANLLFPVIRRALQAQERLAAGQPITFDTEQAACKALLLTEREARTVADFGHDEAWVAPRFLGIRYALTCWLDETLGRQARWQQTWREQSLEAALFGTMHGDTGFWEQAQLALDRPGCDACEVFYLCVHLGFRGARRDAPQEVAAWIKAAKARLAKDLAVGWPAPPALDFAPQAPPLRQRDHLRRVLLAVSVPLTILAPLAAWLVARSFGM